MLTLFLVWLIVAVGFLSFGLRRPGSSVGLPLAYFLGLSLIHVPGAMLYVDFDDWSADRDYTRIGFEETVIGMMAFLVGVAIARLTKFTRRPDPYASMKRPSDFGSHQDLAALNRLALLYLVVGAATYFVVMPLLGGVASLTAVISALGSLIMVGVCLRLWVARQTRDQRKFRLTVACLPLLPLATLVHGGFLGFGTYWVLAIVSFIMTKSKQRMVFVVVAPVVVFLGLSVFVNYMAVRDHIRDVVWRDQQATFSERVQRTVGYLFQNLEWLDRSNSKHRTALTRLNQNGLVGRAVTRLESGQVGYASGATLGDIMVGLIPRAIWPDKPAVGGGGDVVSRFTGLKFAGGTSVGAGQVLEFYVNFATWGVVIGFLFFGWLLGQMDANAGECLRQGDQRGFVFWFVIGIALLQPGGNLLEIAVSAASAAVAGYGIGRFLIGRWPTVSPQTSRALPRAGYKTAGASPTKPVLSKT